MFDFAGGDQIFKQRRFFALQSIERAVDIARRRVEAELRYRRDDFVVLAANGDFEFVKLVHMEVPCMAGESFPIHLPPVLRLSACLGHCGCHDLGNPAIIFCSARFRPQFAYHTRSRACLCSHLARKNGLRMAQASRTSLLTRPAWYRFPPMWRSTSLRKRADATRGTHAASRPPEAHQRRLRSEPPCCSIPLSSYSCFCRSFCRSFFCWEGFGSRCSP